MQPTKADVEQYGSLGGETTQMSLDQTALAHIMSVLTNLYSNTVLAVIREYSSNAYDSHVAAGNPNPIEVFLPTRFAPFFIVKDQGVGLSKDEIQNIYSKYGASTKRHSNEQVGMLGLGCKSALTYTNQFSLRAVKDERLTLVSITQGASGVGETEIVDERDVPGEPNGVEIKIPVKAIDEFITTAEEFFKYWLPGTVLINGKPPKAIECATKITDNTYLLKDENRQWGKAYKNMLVMGNVAYPIEEVVPENNRTRVIFYADIGTLNFTPSREQLHYTSLTKEALTKLYAEYLGGIRDAMQQEINQCVEYDDALKVWQSWQNVGLSSIGQVGLKISDLTYRGHPLEKEWKFLFDKNVGYYQLKNCIIVYNFPDDKLTTYKKAKLSIWQVENNAENLTPVFCNGKPPGSPWTDDIRRVDWNDINKIKIQRKNNTPIFKVDVRGAINKLTDLSDKTIYYYTARERKEKLDLIDGKSWGLSWRTLYDDSHIVVVPSNRIDALKEKYPQAKNIIADLKLKLGDWVRAHKDIYEESISYNDINAVRDLDESRVHDPVVKALIQKYELQTQGAAKSIPKIASLYEAIDIVLNGYQRRITGKREATPIMNKRYPLLQYGRSFEHVYIYLNAAYDQLYKEKNNEV